MSRRDKATSSSGFASPGWPIAAILLLTFVAYLPTMQCGYIWDDDFYVTNNKTLHDIEGLGRIWFRPGATPQYYPLTFTSFW
ncbi:MAG TPA: O-GlcNAc transferase, partial [Phycisphaerae bacterium]|nr:O-GlcNAc transferase [Phycisphaerae bacterium]